MPIKPENRDRYPANWKEVRDQIIKRAMYRCEDCSVAAGVNGYRTPDGAFHEVGDNPEVTRIVAICLELFSDKRLFRIVLTVHHLDEQPENNDQTNLVALCQRCHLAKHRRSGSSPHQTEMQLDRADYDAGVDRHEEEA